MSYSIYIGEATTKIDRNSAIKISVEKTQNDAAPTFKNDGMTGKTNSRHPSYSGWEGFTKETGLYDLFFDQEKGLMREHPGCFLLTCNHLETIQKALKERQEWAKEKGLEPGFLPDGMFFTEEVKNVDAHLARLIWLEYWVCWAIFNCKTPAIYNY
jgi:hypothetical protein